MLKSISDLVKVIGVPVMAKGVGSGYPERRALKLSEVGVSAINVAGLGAPVGLELRRCVLKVQAKA